MPASSSAATSSITSTALVGRSEEIGQLRSGLARAKSGAGNTFLVLGPGGMGKTRLLRWMEQEATSAGFQVSWGYALKEAIAPFFVFQQIFRREEAATPSNESDGSGGTTVLPDPLPAYLLFEEEKPRRFRVALGQVPPSAPLFVISRENPATLRDRGPPLSAGTSFLWVTRVEGDGRLSPGHLDRLGEMAAAHLQSHPGGVVALDVIEYLTSQNSFPPVLRLLQFLRDVAQDTDGHLLVALHPGAFEKREVSLFESDAEVLRIASVRSTSSERPAVTEVSEPPSETLLRYLRTLEAASLKSPQLVVVDDLHWADAQSGTAFQFLCRNLRNLRVVLVGGAREDEIPAKAEEGGPSLAERLEGLSQEGALARIPLRAFGLEETRSLAHEVLEAPLAPGQTEDLQTLVKRTEGNPYFLRETFLQLKEEKGLRRAEEGYKFTLLAGGRSALSIIPTSLRRLVVRRLERLDERERSFLNTAAVAGSDFDLPPLATVLNVSLETARAIAERLERTYRLIEVVSGPSGTGWFFSHPMVWEVTMAELPADDRRRDALALLDWWESHKPDDLGTLARLGHDTGDLIRAGSWVRKAFEASVELFAPESAMTYLTWLHELHRTGGRRPSDEEIQLEVRSARQVARGGGPRQAYRFLGDLLREPLDETVRFEARFSLAQAADNFDMIESRRIVDGLVREMERPGAEVPTRLRHAVTTLRVYHFLQEGQHQEGVTTIQPVLEASLDDMDPDIALMARMFAVSCEEGLGHIDRAQEILARAETLAQGSVEARARLTNIRAILQVHAGEVNETIRLTLEAARLSRQAGFLSSAMICEYNAGYLLMEAGREEEAETIARQVLEIGRKFDLPRLRCCGTYLLSKLAVRRGQLTSASEWGASSLRDAKLSGRTDDIRDCRALMAEIWGRSGELARGLAEFEMLEKEGAFSGAPQIAEIFPILAELLERNGETERALAVAQRALEAQRSLRNEKGMTRTRALIDRITAGRSATPEA